MLSSTSSVNDSIHSFITVIQHVHYYYNLSVSQFASILQHFIPRNPTKKKELENRQQL